MAASTLCARPKIGLVLSGGGGKGFAHIGVLRVLEREHIPIDYISGTSIGAIIGFLYSIGYTVDELEEIVNEIDWDHIFIDAPKRIDKPMDEKLFSERYAFSLPFEDNRIKLPKGLISGQKVYMTLKKYAWDARGVKNFDHFPIPFRAVATNLATGEAIVLDHGDIVRALNGSMAIPSFFRPIKWGDTVITDGLSSKNFPVDEVLDMGAEVVIGSDIGAPNADVDDLSFLGVLNQVQAFRGRDSTREQKKKVDILIEPNISAYSPVDFSKKEELIALGERATIENLPKLEKYKVTPEEAIKETLVTDVGTASKALINHVEIRGLYKVEDKFIYPFIKKELPFLTDQYEIDDIIKEMYALGFFKRIYYEIEGDTLVFTFEETEDKYINLGLNYTSMGKYNNASIILGTTLSSFGIAGSKTNIDLSISQYPTVSATNFLYYSFGAFKKVGVISNVTFDKDYIFEYDSDGDDTVQRDYNEVSIDMYGGSIFGRKTLMGFGFTYDKSSYAKVTDKKDIEEVLSFYFKSTYDSYNKSAYPTKGANISFVMRGAAKLLNQEENDFEFSKVSLYGERNLELFDGMSINGAFQFESVLGEKVPKKYRNILKGVTYENNDHGFYGISPEGMEVNTSILFRVGVQVEVANDLYLQLITNSVSVNKNEDELNSYSGYGIGLGYDSFLGPVDFMVTNNIEDEDSLLFHFNFGYKF